MSYSSHLAQLELRTRLSYAHFERLQRSCPTRGILNQFRPCLNLFQLVENAYTVIEAATGTGTASGCNVFTHPGRSKHIKLDLRPCVHTDPRLVIDLPVFLSELCAQVYKVVTGTVAPEPLSVSKAKFITQVDLDELQAD